MYLTINFNLIGNIFKHSCKKVMVKKLNHIPEITIFISCHMIFEKGNRLVLSGCNYLFISCQLQLHNFVLIPLSFVHGKEATNSDEGHT